MLSFIDKLFERLGRKYALVDFTGTIIGYRYYIGYIENHIGSAKWLPNIYIHNFLDPRGIDGVTGVMTFHYHPWDACSLVLRGGYEEHREGMPSAMRRAGRLHFMPRMVKHAIGATVPNTWTILMHWFKKDEWRFSIEPCKNICDKCANTIGECRLRTQTLTMNDMVNGSGQGTKSSWRGTQWHKCGVEFDKWLSRRKKALSKIGNVTVNKETVLEYVRKEQSS